MGNKSLFSVLELHSRSGKMSKLANMHKKVTGSERKEKDSAARKKKKHNENVFFFLKGGRWC